MKLLTRGLFLGSAGGYRLWSCSVNLMYMQLGSQDTLVDAQPPPSCCTTAWATWHLVCLTASDRGESHVHLYGAAENFGAEIHTHTFEATEKCCNYYVSFYYTTSGLYSLSKGHTNKEAGEQKVNRLRYFSGGLKTHEGT